MKVNDLVKALKLKVYSGEDGLERPVNGGYVSDLLSDVMGHAREDNIWITLQTHKNIMAIASLKDLAAIILVKNNKPAPDTIEKSCEEKIPVLGTELSTFEISGKVYELLQQKARQSIH